MCPHNPLLNIVKLELWKYFLHAEAAMNSNIINTVAVKPQNYVTEFDSFWVSSTFYKRGVEVIYLWGRVLGCYQHHLLLTTNSVNRKTPCNFNAIKKCFSSCNVTCRMKLIFLHSRSVSWPYWNWTAVPFDFQHILTKSIALLQDW